MGVLISLVFLYLAFQKVELRKIVEASKEANYIHLFPAFIFLILWAFFRVVRWKYLLLPAKNIGLASLFSATMIGFMANNLLPARMGELIKVYFIGKRENISKSLSMATVILERVFDVLIILIFLVLLLIISPFPQWVDKAGYIVTGVLGTVIFLLFMLKFKADYSLIVSNKIFYFLPDKITIRINKILKSFIAGLNVLGTPKYILLIIIYSFLAWIASGIMIYFVLLAFNINLPLYASFFVLVVVSLGIAIPSSPGFIGTYHFFCIVALSVFGVSKDIAGSFSIFFHALGYIPLTLTGLICLWRENISLLYLKKLGV